MTPLFTSLVLRAICPLAFVFHGLLFHVNKIYLAIPLWICLRDSVVPHLVYYMAFLGLGCHLVCVGSGCNNLNWCFGYHL